MANAENRASHALYTRSLEDLNVIDNFLFTELSTNEDVNEEFFRIPAVHLSAAGIPFRESDRAEELLRYRHGYAWHTCRCLYRGIAW